MRISIPIDIPGPLLRRHVVRSPCHTYQVRIVCMGEKVWMECSFCENPCMPVLVEEWAAEREASRVLHEDFARIGELMTDSIPAIA